jgi:hypothetical protein
MKNIGGRSKKAAKTSKNEQKNQPDRSVGRVKAIGIHRLILLQKINLVKQQNSNGFVVTPVEFAGV